jgi:hypothetical protein
MGSQSSSRAPRSLRLRPRRQVGSNSRWPWWLVLVGLFFALLILARFLLVRFGLLYGADRILAIDVTISAALVIGLALGRRAMRRNRSSTHRDSSPGTWTDWFGVAATVLGVPALVVALMTLLAPATPNGLGAPACAGAQTYGLNYFGVTVGPLGNYARSGAGLSFAQTDRFDTGCTLGFVGYCIGDAVDDPTVGGWTETRWLLVGRHTMQPGKALARILSGELEDRRFVSLSYIAPKSPDRNLRYLGDDECPGARSRPGLVSMTPVKSGNGAIRFDVQSLHAERIGVALALSPDVLRAGSEIRRVDSQATKADGRASITWQVPVTLSQLVPNRVEPAQVVVLAVACLGPVGPADVETAATRTFRIETSGEISEVPLAAPPSAEIRDRLRRAACDSEGFNARKQQTEGNSPSPATN